MFTGIDHRQNCVTFGAALLFDETTASYSWMLECFLKVHKKQPTFAVTDQDGALRKAILKVLGDVEADSDFRKDFHKLVLNVYITPEVFQERWHNLISKYNLGQNTWLSDMYAIRERWVPGYFRKLPFCGLMKTTSRSESSNAFFQVYSHHGNSLVHFMLCFESAMEKQRYTQRVLDNAPVEKTSVMLTQLPIERHACEVYTHSIFRDVQDEIYKGLYACSRIDFRTDGDVDHCHIRQRDKRSNTVVEATNYISHHWPKNPLPNHLRDKRHRYGPCIEKSEVLASEIYSTVEDSINLIRNDPDKLRVFLSKVKDLKHELEIDAPSQNTPQNKDALYEDLLGVKAPPRVSIKNPKKCPNKGHRRFKGAAEKGKAKKKARINRKVPFRQRECGKCGQLATEEVNESDEDEEVNESEEDNVVDEYDDVEEDDELDEDDVNDDYDEDEDDA
ncbi:FAR1-related sequence 5-like protein, partial [Tanacetum coccineum]